MAGAPDIATRQLNDFGKDFGKNIQDMAKVFSKGLKKMPMGEIYAAAATKAATAATAKPINELGAGFVKFSKSILDKSDKTSAKIGESIGKSLATNTKAVGASIGKALPSISKGFSIAFEDSPIANALGSLGSDMAGWMGGHLKTFGSFLWSGKKEKGEEEPEKVEGEDGGEFEQASSEAEDRAQQTREETLAALIGAETGEEERHDENLALQFDAKMDAEERAREAGKDGGAEPAAGAPDAPDEKAVGGLKGMLSKIPGFKSIAKLFAGGLPAIGNLLGKIFWPITMIIGIVSFFTGFIKEFGETGDFVEGIKGGLENIVEILIDIPLHFMKDALAWILDLFGFGEAAKAVDDFEFDLSGMLRTALDFMDPILDFIFWPFHAITDFIEGFKQGGILEGVIVMIEGMLGNIVDAPLNFIKGIMSSILGMLGMEEAQENLDSFDFNVSSLVRPVIDFISDLWNKITELWDSISNFFSNQWKKVTGGFKSFFGLGGDEEEVEEAPEKEAFGGKRSIRSAQRRQQKLREEEKVVRAPVDRSKLDTFGRGWVETKGVDEEGFGYTEKKRVGGIVEEIETSEMGAGNVYQEDAEARLQTTYKRMDQAIARKERLEERLMRAYDEDPDMDEKKEAKLLKYIESAEDNAKKLRKDAEGLQEKLYDPENVMKWKSRRVERALTPDTRTKAAGQMQEAGLERGAGGGQANIIVNQTDARSSTENSSPVSFAGAAGNTDSDPSLAAPIQ